MRYASSGKEPSGINRSEPRTSSYGPGIGLGADLRGGLGFQRSYRFDALLSRSSGWGYSSSASHQTRLLMLCAEPGMGKTYLVNEILSQRKRLGHEVRILTLKGEGVDATPSLISKTALAACRQGGVIEAMTFAIDDIPAADECDVAKEARALMRMAEAGIDVVACMRPETEALCEALPGALCLRSSDLALRDEASAHHRDAFWERTHGIPALVAAALADPFPMGAPVAGGRYLRTLAGLVLATLRKGLPEEERRLRLAMLLLGRGTAEELRGVTGRLDSDALCWLRRDGLLFGIGSRAESFSCGPLLDEAAFAACADSLEKAARSIAGGVEIVRRSAALLATRGEYKRMAGTCALMPADPALLEPTLQWGCELVAIGEAGLVRKALDQELALRADAESDKGGQGLEDGDRFGGDADACLSAASRALLLMGSRPADGLPGRLGRGSFSGSVDISGAGSMEPTSEHLYLLGQARLLKSSLSPQNQGPAWDLAMPGISSKDHLSRALLAHLRTRSLIMQGRFSDSYRLLVNNPDRLEGLGLVSGLLANDYEMACVLAGELPDQADKDASHAARALFAQAGGPRLTTYRGVLEPALGVLMGRGGRVPGIEHACARAESAGDIVVQATLLMVAAVCDLRSQMISRAHVRALQSHELSLKAGCTYLAQSSALVDCVARLCAGDDSGLRDLEAWQASSSGVMDLWRVLACSQGAGATPDPRLDVLSWEAFPRDLGWLVDLLAFDSGAASAAFRAGLSPQWSSQLERQHERMGVLFGGGRTEERVAPWEMTVCRENQAVTEQEEPLMRVNVLGRFEVTVDGVVVDPRKFQRRKARELLLLLCTTRSHKVQRFVALDSIWGTTDYVSGLQKIYDATSVIRSATGMREHGRDPLVSSKGEGTIALNPDVVSTDFDDFVREARLALAAEADDQGCVRHACGMSELLPGGFEASLAGFPMLAGRQKKQLRDLYADAAVAGSDAALRLKRPHVAGRLAADAHDADPLREDAMISLMGALGSLGRAAEARALYDDFSCSLVASAGAAPSPRLKKAAERAIGGADSSSHRA